MSLIVLIQIVSVSPLHYNIAALIHKYDMIDLRD